MIVITAHNTIMSVDLAYLFILYMFSKHSIPSHITSDRGLEFVPNFFCPLSTTLDIQLHFTTTSKVINKPNTLIRLSRNINTSMYIVITSKITSLNSWHLQSSLTIMFLVLLLMFLHFLLISIIIQTSPFTLNMILLPSKPITLP